jgi:hypothetical protein
VPIFVHIGHAGSEDKPKRGLGAKLGHILNFDLSVRDQICEFKKMGYGLVPKFKVLHCAKLCQNWTVPFRVIPKMDRIGVKFGQNRPNFDL